MSAVLLDTHALIWFMNGDFMTAESLVAIDAAQAVNGLYVSPISAWEASLALRKQTGTPDLGDNGPGDWFKAVMELPGARLAGVTKRVALEAAVIPAIYGSGDPGDCFLIATARVRKLPIITRDSMMIALSRRRPEYLRTIIC